MKRFAHPALVGAALIALATPAAAQLNSLPVFHSPKGGTGLTISADVGRGLNEESGENTAVAVRAAVGVSALTLEGGIGVVNPELTPGDRETEVQYMGKAAFRLLGGALMPVSLSIQAGVGYLRRDRNISGVDVDLSELNIPIGLGFGLNVPTPGFSVEPWLAPRLSITRTMDVVGTQGTGRETQAGLGVSGGINIGILTGMGLHVAVDWTELNEGDVFPERTPVVFGAGLHYTFRIPSLM